MIHFFKSLGIYLLKFNDPEAISKQLTVCVNKALITQQMKKSNKVHGFFKSLAQPLLKYNDPEAISKQLITQQMKK